MKNNNLKKNKLLLIIFVILFQVMVIAAEDVIVFDPPFFKKLSLIHPLGKDTFFENLQNRIIIGKGKILNVSLTQRYKKKYRIVIEASESSQFNHKIFFYVFLDNKNTTDILNPNTTFEFKGQLMGYTPLGTRRNEYILDVIFMEGSTLIE